MSSVGDNASSIFSNFIRSSSKDILELKKKENYNSMYFKRTTQYIVISVRYYYYCYYYDNYYTRLLEYLLKFNHRGIIIHGQDGGGAGSFRRYGLV